ncbi:MAG TPA: NADH-quinone oxidoreductase subunit H [Candidatus Paceibacterota bacterium]
MSYLLWTIQLLLIPLFSPLAIGLTRSVKARFQNRRGASPLQPYNDLWKLLHKGEVQSVDASWIFRIAPFIVFTATLVIAASIPLVSLTTHSSTSDLLFLIGLLALEAFWIALAGLDVGSPFGGFGSSRQMMVAAFTEGVLVLSLFALALMRHTTDLFGIAAGHGAVVPVAVAGVAFFIALLSETMRYPFDNPATHLELTMIHEAMILEYSGPRLALMEWAAANKYLIFIALFANLFVPIYAVSALALIVKALVVIFFIATLESSIAKLRIFRLPDLLFTATVLSIIAIVLSL